MPDPQLLRFKQRVLPLLFLLRVILQSKESNIAQQKNHQDVFYRHKAHQNIGQIPYGGKIRLCPKKDYGNRKQSEYKKCLLIVDDKFQIAFRIAVIANQGGKGKQDNGIVMK